MGIVTSNWDGKCSKCGGEIKKGEKVCVEKGKPRLCVKCAPSGVTEKKYYNQPKQDIRDVYALEILKAIMKRHEKMLVADTAVVTFKLVDAIMAERGKRGMK
jgi:ribosome-binding protein aMBF1 (putative translation factor)